MPFTGPLFASSLVFLVISVSVFPAVQPRKFLFFCIRDRLVRRPSVALTQKPAHPPSLRRRAVPAGRGVVDRQVAIGRDGARDERSAFRLEVVDFLLARVCVKEKEINLLWLRRQSRDTYLRQIQRPSLRAVLPWFRDILFNILVRI